MAAESSQPTGPALPSPGGQKLRTTEVDPEETAFVRLQGQWEKHMKDISPKKKHLKVEVLLLYWEKIFPSYLDTSEVDDLEKVFQEAYNFNVHRCILNPPDQSDAMLWIQFKLAEFLLKHDSHNSLLIIYYAGHGTGLSLRGGNPSTKSQKSEVDEITWSRAEVMIDTAKRADFLLIFDCCFAGKLAGFQSRKDFSKTNFDFLGASGPNQLAEVPGEKSFTFALIRALRELANDAEGFTTSELFNKILECPTFPKEEQTPCMLSKKNCVEKLLLAPLAKKEGITPAATVESKADPTLTPLDYCLRLDFLLPRLPSDDEMVEMCDGFKCLIHEKRLMAQKIVWNTLHRKEVLPPAARAAAHKWLSETWRKKSRPSLSEDRKRSSDNMSGSPTESSPLETTESPIENFAQNSRTDCEHMKKRRKT